MPRFFFDIYDGMLGRDEEGLDCTDVEAAVRQAMQAARELSRDRHGTSASDHRLDVRDENGTVIASIFFHELL